MVKKILNWLWSSEPAPSTISEKLHVRRSFVRTSVTHGAAWFLFGGGAALIIYLVVFAESPDNSGRDPREQGVDLFLTILPVAAAIVSYWFAGRRQDVAQPQEESEPVESS